MCIWMKYLPWCFFLHLNIISNAMITALDRISKSNKPATIPPITADELLFVGCFVNKLTWHSSSSKEEIAIIQLLSTLISTLWTGIVISFLIHRSMYEEIAELEAFVPPWWRMARKVTAWGEAGKQRNTPFVMFSRDNPHWQCWLILKMIAVEISFTLVLVLTFCTCIISWRKIFTRVMIMGCNLQPIPNNFELQIAVVVITDLY